MGFEQKGEKIFITELPRGYDAKKIYKFLNKHIDNDFMKDYIDSTVDNDINIELVWNKGVAFGLFSMNESTSYNLITLVIFFVITTVLCINPGDE